MAELSLEGWMITNERANTAEVIEPMDKYDDPVSNIATTNPAPLTMKKTEANNLQSRVPGSVPSL